MEERETIGEIVDKVSVGRFHFVLLAVIGGMWATMSIAILSIAFTLPIFIDIWSLSGTAAGILGSATLVGMILGNTLGGRYADSAGRKRTVVVSILQFSVFTALTGLAVGFYTATALRFLTGIGLGSALVAGTSYFSEYLPTSKRARYITYLEAFFSIGSLITVTIAWIVLRVVPTDGTIYGIAAWRAFFLVGIFPIGLAFVLSRYMPESPYYLVAKGEVEAALRNVAEMAQAGGATITSNPSAVVPADSESVGWARLFRGGLVWTTVLVTSIWFAVNLGYYGIFTWLPDTVAVAGYSENLYRFLFLVAVFQLFGQLSAAYFVETIGRKWTLSSLLLVGGGSTLLFAYVVAGDATGSTTVFSIGLYAMSFSLFGAWAVLYAYTSEVFPTNVRSTALGFTGAVGKAAGAAGPIFFGALAEISYLLALAPIAVVFAGVGVALLAFGRETKGETLG